MPELVIARNPDPDSSLPFLLHVPLGTGLVFRTSGTWPREKALYCYPVHLREWPSEPEVVESVPLRSLERRGAAIDIVADRGREHRSQLVFTRGRGRDMVFWQSPKTRKQARPNVSVPTARAAGIADLEVIIDSHERYPYRFADAQVTTVKQALPCGDYGVRIGGRLVASVERKGLADLASSATDGRLRFALSELAGLPRAAVVVEEGYGKVFGLQHVRPAVVADAVAELQVRYPNVPIVFCESRKLAEQWTYRFLAAAMQWVSAEDAAMARVGVEATEGTAAEAVEVGGAAGAAGAGWPATAVVRAWALGEGLPVSDRGRLRPEVWSAWREAHREQ